MGFIPTLRSLFSGPFERMPLKYNWKGKCNWEFDVVGLRARIPYKLLHKSNEFLFFGLHIELFCASQCNEGMFDFFNSCLKNIVKNSSGAF